MVKRFSSRVAVGAMVACLGCGDDATDTTGSGGDPTSSSSTTQNTTSAGGSDGGMGTGGNSSSTATGTGGTGGGCPDIDCATPCAYGYWDGLDGCQTCACAPPPLELTVNGATKDPTHLTLDTTASELIGGIDRWVFDFTWNYDDPLASDDQEIVQVSVRIMRTGPEYEPSETNATWFYPESSGAPLEIPPGDYTLYGFGVLMDTLTPVSGYLSIRRVDDVFEGGVVLKLEGQGVAAEVQALGKFSVAVP